MDIAVAKMKGKGWRTRCGCLRWRFRYVRDSHAGLGAGSGAGLHFSRLARKSRSYACPWGAVDLPAGSAARPWSWTCRARSRSWAARRPVNRRLRTIVQALSLTYYRLRKSSSCDTLGGGTFAQPARRTWPAWRRTPRGTHGGCSPRSRRWIDRERYFRAHGIDRWIPTVVGAWRAPTTTATATCSLVIDGGAPRSSPMGPGPRGHDDDESRPVAGRSPGHIGAR